MKAVLQTCLACLVLTLLFAMEADPSQATSLVPRSVGQLTDGSELIFMGTAVHRDEVVNAAGDYAYTFYTFSIEQILKGDVDGAHLTLRFDGGSLNESEYLEVVGMPTFDEGGRYLLFVAGNGRLASPLVGWNQGRLEVRAHPRTGEDILVDHHGYVIAGLHAEQWTRSTARLNADGLLAQNGRPLAEVVSEEGVEIIAGPVVRFAEKRQASLPDQISSADAVLGDLSRLLGERTFLKSHRPGGLVESASLFDIPASKSFRSVNLEER